MTVKSDIIDNDIVVSMHVVSVIVKSDNIVYGIVVSMSVVSMRITFILCVHALSLLDLTVATGPARLHAIPPSNGAKLLEVIFFCKLY